jgi:hypothetical protein
MKEARTEFEFGIKLASTLARLKLGGIGVSYEDTTTYTYRVELRVHFTA